jgi:hypothetical protein
MLPDACYSLFAPLERILLWFLCSVFVLGASVYLEALQAAITKFIGREHAANSLENNLCRIIRHKILELPFTQTAWEAAVIVVHFLFFFAASHLQFIGIHHDDKVAAIYVLSKHWLAFARQERCNLRGNTAERGF